MNEFEETQKKHKQILEITDNELELIQASLPSKKYYEFAYHKLFTDKNANFHQWIDCNYWTYPVQDLIRFNKIIIDNTSYIKNKKIVDFCCHIGYLSLFSLHLGATSVLGTNIRKDCLDIAQNIIDLAGFSVKYKSLVSDIHDYECNTKICQDVDTVLLCGIMYHVHDHYQIIESITKKNPKTIILDTKESLDIMDNKEPLIRWYHESTENPIYGSYNNNNEILVGHPNEAFFTCVFESLKYKKITSSRYKMLANEKENYKVASIRSVQVYESIE